MKLSKTREDVRFTPRFLDGVRVCALEEFNCSRPFYSRGLCANHYQQWLYRGYLGDLNWYRGVRPRCDFQGCHRLAQSKRGGMCGSHLRQIKLGQHLHPVIQRNSNFTEAGRVCKVCNEEKTLNEYYRRNQAKGQQSIATKCKQCYIKEVRARDAAGRRA